MIGTRLEERGRNGGTYEITAVHGGLYVLVRMDVHQPPTTVSTGELHERFLAKDVEIAEPVIDVDADLEAGWRALAEDSARAAEVQSTGVRPGGAPPALHVEEQLRRLAEADA